MDGKCAESHIYKKPDYNLKTAQSLPTKGECRMSSSNREENKRSTLQLYSGATKKTGVVFSAQGSYNPTNLAVENSLKEIFETFQTMVTGELRLISENPENNP